MPGRPWGVSEKSAGNETWVRARREIVQESDDQTTNLLLNQHNLRRGRI